MVKEATLEREGSGNTMEQQCGLDFEYFVQTIFDDRDISVFETPQTNDYGADLILYRLGKVAVIQCKYHSAPIGIRAVQEVVGAIKYYQADCGIVITNQVFTKQAISLAESNHVLLISGTMLQRIADSVSDTIPYIDEFLSGLRACNEGKVPMDRSSSGADTQPNTSKLYIATYRRKARRPEYVRLRTIKLKK